MGSASLAERVLQIVIENLGGFSGIKIDEVKMESRFVDDLGMDSLDVVELQMALEEEFGIEIMDEEISMVNTVRECVDYVEGKIESKEASA